MPHHLNDRTAALASQAADPALLAQLLQTQVQAAVSQDRQRMAAEVHDSVAQALAFVKMRLPLLHDAMLAHDDGQALRYYEDVRGTLAQAHTSLRQILADLRAPLGTAQQHVLADPRDFIDALRDLALDFQARHSITLALDLPAASLPVSPTQRVQVLHVAQEALFNLARHAQATTAWLSLQSQDGQVQLQVCDDGCGMAPVAPSAASGHYGIDIMQGRARRLGGSLEIGPREGGGTCVILRFPLEAPTVAAA